MIQKITSLLLCVALISSCSNKQLGSEIIRVNDAKQMKLNLSDYVVSLEYVPLETKQECLIDRSPNFFLLDEYIVVTTSQQCFLFSRSGKFIREIGRAGRGPDEYSYASSCVINEEKQTIIIPSWSNKIEYSFDGKVIKYFPTVPNTSSTMAYVSDSILVQGVSNLYGDAINQLVFINKEKVIDSIPNHQFFTPIDRNVFGGFGLEFRFYQYRDDLYYKNMFNDTLFKIKGRKLHPAWVFDMGQYHLSRSVMENMNTFRQETGKYNWLQYVWEADPFLLFSITRDRGDSTFVYDKRKDQIFVMEKEQKLKGFYNDIDGGMPFWPSYINRKQEMVTSLYPDAMKEMLTNEYFGRKNIRDNNAHLRLKELLSRMNEDDNPVVVIAKLKL